MSLSTKMIATFSSLRVKKIERYVKDSIAIQERQFQAVVQALAATHYGDILNIKHSPKDYKEYSSRVPITEYENIRSLVERMLQGEKNILIPGGCTRFAVSSGTSGGRSKYIPVNDTHLQHCHFRGGSDALWLYLSTRPDSRFFSTKGLVLGGSSAPVAQGKNILAGDLSSILIEKMPPLGRHIRVPQKSTLLMNEWNAKMEAIVQEVKGENIGSLSGVPSWMLVMIHKVLEEEGKKDLSEVWPELEVFFHGGISFDQYRHIYHELIPLDRMQYRETYNASEGFFGIQDDPSDRALLLMLDYGIFYEFIPIKELESPHPQAIPLEDVKVGETYAMLISTLGGLYRYMIGDTVKFTQKDPYKFLIVGRTALYINSFGEELMISNTNNAIAIVSKEMRCSVLDYTVAPLLIEKKAQGRHQWIVEFDTEPADLSLFATRLDEELRKINSDYDAKRYSNMTLLPLQLFVASKGFFNSFLEDEGKLGGQHKVPRLRNDRKIIDKLLQRKGLKEIKSTTVE